MCREGGAPYHSIMFKADLGMLAVYDAPVCCRHYRMMATKNMATKEVDQSKEGQLPPPLILISPYPPFCIYHHSVPWPYTSSQHVRPQG